MTVVIDDSDSVRIPGAGFETVDVNGGTHRMSVGASAWGSVAVSVPEAHWPRILPIKCAFEMRPFVDAEAERPGLQSAQPVDSEPTAWSRHALCASVLASAIGQTAATLAPQIATTLALGVASWDGEDGAGVDHGVRSLSWRDNSIPREPDPGRRRTSPTPGHQNLEGRRAPMATTSWQLRRRALRPLRLLPRAQAVPSA